MVTESVSQTEIRGIHAVFPVAQTVFIQKGKNLGPGHIQQGTDKLAPFGCNPPKTFQAGAPDQVHQHGFGIVIGGVGGGNFTGEGIEIGIPGIPGSGFQPFFSGGNVGRAYVKGNSVAGAEIPDKLFIDIRLFRLQMVIEMDCGKIQIPFFLQKIHGPQQSDGIGAAGNGTDDALTPGNQIVLLNETAKLTQHASTPGQ